MIPALSEDTPMYAATRDHTGRPAVAMLIAMSSALLLACSGGEKTQSTVSVAEASPVVTPVSTDTPTTPVESSATTLPPEAAFENALAAYNAGEYRIAAEMYRSDVRTKVDNAHAHYMLGLSSWKSGDFPEAMKAFDRSLELDPGFAKGYFNKARVLLDLDRSPEALEMIEKGRAIDSTSPDGWRLKARAQAESGDVDGAITTYRELLVRDDSDVWGLNNYGVLLLDRGEFEEALGPLARLVQVRPTSPLFQNNFGMALERSGYKVAALRHYEEGVRHDSTFAKAVKNAERLKALSLDPAAEEVVSELDLAERFRQKVKAWKDTVTK
jgi:tetratricopeptide (TPR) repeat protein